MSAVTVMITKRVVTDIDPPRPYQRMYESTPRLVSQIFVVWHNVSGRWLPEGIRFESSRAKKDGTPSQRVTSNGIYGSPSERAAFSDMFPEAFARPTEDVSVTIDGEPR